MTYVSERTSPSSPAAKAVFVLLTVALCGLALNVVLADVPRLISTVPDDASYFFKVAANIAAGEGATFDGIQKTNGYQPLWTYTLAGLFTAVGGTPEFRFRVVLVLQLLMLAAAGASVLRVHLRFHSSWSGVIACLLFVLLVQIPGSTGMESALHVLTLSLLLVLGVGWRVFEEHHPTREFVFGLALGAAMLARLDTIFLGATLAVACLPVARRDRGAAGAAFVRLSLIVAGASVVVVPYLTHNLLAFGHIVPTSGLLKSSFPHPQLTPRVFANFSVLKVGATFAAVAVAVAYLVWFAASRRADASLGRSEARTLYRSALAVMAAAILVHFPYSLLFMRWAEAWHFIPYGLFMSLAAGSLSDAALIRFTPQARRSVLVGGSAALFLLGSLAVVQRMNRPLASSWHVVSYEAAVWAREHSSESEVYCMANAGHFGYFSERRVVNLDGLVGRLRFQEVLKERRLNEFLRDNDVGYIVEHTFSDRRDNDDIVSGRYGRIDLPFRSLLYDVQADSVTVLAEDEVYRSGSYQERGCETVLVIWKLPHDDVLSRAPRVCATSDTDAVACATGVLR